MYYLNAQIKTPPLKTTELNHSRKKKMYYRKIAFYLLFRRILEAWQFFYLKIEIPKWKKKKKKKKEKKKNRKSVQVLKIKDLLRELQDVCRLLTITFIWADGFVDAESSSAVCSKHLWMRREWHFVLCTLINEAGIPRFAITCFQWRTSTQFTPSPITPCPNSTHLKPEISGTSGKDWKEK